VRRLSLVICLLAPALAGCGASSSANSAKDFKGDQKAVAQTVDDFSKAVRDNDQGKICTDLLARALVTRLDASAQKCTGAVSDQLDAAGDTKLDVKTVRVAGGRATATVVSKVDGNDRTQTLSLVNENGGWRLSGVSG
jgi:hypothetical protein